MIDRIERAAEMLSPRGGPHPSWRWLSRPVDGRGVVEFRPCESGDPTVAKFYPDDTGRRTFDAMSLVRRAAPPGSGLHVPLPVAWDRRLRMLVTESARGASYEDLSPDADHRERMRLAGRALGVLHGIPVPSLRVRSLADHLEELVRPRPRQLAAALPEHRATIEAALDALGERALPARPVPLHRDFHLRQLVEHGGGVWILDWDSFAPGEAGFDVTTFVVYLENHWPRDAAARGARSFLEGYAETSPVLPPDESRERLFRTFHALRRACRRFRLRDVEWESRMRASLRLLEATSVQ